MLSSLIAVIAPPCCLACGAPVPVRADLCRECRGELPWLAGPVTLGGMVVHSPVAHDGPARALVHGLKFAGRTAAAATMAAQIVATAPRGLLASGVLVPVPAHPARRRGRGFDQAELLARRLARRTARPVATVLRRAGRAGPQVGAGRARRLGRDLGITARRPLAGRVILVDDVLTTGATLTACAAALRAAGPAVDVVAVTYARALG